MFNLMIGSITLLFFAAFITIYLTNRHLKAAGWMSGAFLLGIIAHLIQQNSSLLEPYYLNRLAEPAFLSTSICVLFAYASRHKTAINLKLVLAIISIGVVVINLTDVVSIQRVLLEWTAISLHLYGCKILAPHRKLYPGNMQFWFNLLSVGIFALRSLIIVADIQPAGWESSFIFYESTLYLTSAILSIIGANVVFLALGSDLLEGYQKAAMVDPLTGLLNRRGMAEIFKEIDKVVSSSAHTGRAVLLFDIDHFKKVNDEFGHDTGDTVLTNIGQTVSLLMRHHGEAARTGGEEFIVLFNAESSAAAFLVAEHLRVSISLLKHEGIPHDRRVTASFGLAFIRSHEPIKRLIRRADMAMYAAKDAGRNRLRLAEGDNLPDADEAMILPRIKRA